MVLNPQQRQDSKSKKLRSSLQLGNNKRLMHGDSKMTFAHVSVDVLYLYREESKYSFILFSKVSFMAGQI